MKNFVTLGIVLIICGLLAVSLGGGDASKPAPTPAPASDGPAVAVAIMDGMQPLVVSSAGAVDTLAELANPDPKPTFYETWGVTLSALCMVGLVLGFASLTVIVWILARAGLFVEIVKLLKYKAV